MQKRAKAADNRPIRAVSETAPRCRITDDRGLAIASRALRRNQNLRQVELVTRGRSRRFVLGLEAGSAADLRLGDLREHFARLGASLRVNVYWNGAELDRLIDERHANGVEAVIHALRADGWATLAEVTFAAYGERGSIDVFGLCESEKAVFVGEFKSEWGALEETNRALDVKARLAPKLCFDRFGWRPKSVAKVLIFPADGRARRVAARYSDTLASVYPAGSREVRSWIKRPQGSMSALWFLPKVT